MAYADSTWYLNSVGYTAVTPFAISTAYTVGQIRRQLATPAVGSERCFVVIIAGTSAASEPSWVLTRGAKTVSNTVTFMECTGQAALNGDSTNVHTWTTFKALAISPSLGVIIKRNSGASYQICTTANPIGASEPAFSDTAGVTTTDGTAVWTSLGAVSGFSSTRTPHARLSNVCQSGWFIAGGTIYVASNHNESQATAMNITTSSSATGINKIICHNVSGSYPPASGDMTTGATIATTASQNVTVISGGYTYWYGLTLKTGVGMSAGSAVLQVYTSTGGYAIWENCSFRNEHTNSGLTSYIQVGSTGSTIGNTVWNNCTVRFGHATQCITPCDGWFHWQNTGAVLASGSAVPSNFIVFARVAPIVSHTVLDALDLSQVTGVLLDHNGAGQQVGSAIIRDCKLHPLATVATPASPGMFFQLSRSAA